MDRDAIGEQLRIEQELLKNIVGGLRKALDWTPQQAGASRRLSTLRFVTESFGRHFERLMAIHEFDGYMCYVTQESPHLQQAVDALKAENDRLQDELRRVISRLERLSPTDLAALNRTSDDLRQIIRKYDERAEKEWALLQEAFFRVEGGPG
jgi:hypothetical protein